MAMLDKDYAPRALELYAQMVKDSKEDNVKRYWQMEASTLIPIAEEIEVLDGLVKGERQAPESDLVKKLSGIAALVFMAFGIFMLSPIVTGNVVASVVYNNTAATGAFLFLIGLVAAFYFFEKK
jgi:uncharacterized membrane protein YqjE